MFCHKCGNQQPEDAAFCEKCGAKLIADNPETHKPVEQTSSQKIVPPVKPKKKSIFKIILIIFGGFIVILVLLMIIGAIMMVSSGEEGANRITVESSTESNLTAEEEMSTADTPSNTENQHQDEILYNGLAVIQFFNASIIQDVLGDPLKVEEYPSSYELYYTDMRFVIGGTGVRSVVCDNPSSFEVNGASLDTTRAELTKIFGDPAQEGWNEWNEELYEVIYKFNDYDLTFNFDSLDGKVDYFYLAPTLADYYDDENYEQSMAHADMGDFNQRISFGELEIVIYENHEVGRHFAVDTLNDYIFLFPEITNAGSSPTTLNQYDVSIFGPSGLEITPIQGAFANNIFYDPLSQGRGNIMPGASQTLMIIIPYQGAGDYSVFFNGLMSQASLTLPISRDTAYSSRGIVGAWSLDSALSDGYYASIGVENIEFLENGNGNITENGTANTFVWYILLTDGNSRLAIQGSDNMMIYSDTLIYPSSLYLANTSTYRLWTSAGIMRDESKKYEGVDEFIRN